MSRSARAIDARYAAGAWAASNDLRSPSPLEDTESASGCGCLRAQAQVGGTWLVLLMGIVGLRRRTGPGTSPSRT